MRASEYRMLREAVGSQAEVSELLGVHRSTLGHREKGNPRYPIGAEAEYAMRWLLWQHHREEVVDIIAEIVDGGLWGAGRLMELLQEIG